MKSMQMRKKVIMICIILLLVVVYLFYSRPMALSELYPMLTLDKCVEITGYYRIGEQQEHSRFVIEKNDEEFEELYNQFYLKTYRRSLKDILPRGTRSHRVNDEDFQWDVYFTFKDVEFFDGSTGSGMLLHFQNWYGELDISFDGERFSCYTNEQEVWEKEVLEVILVTD